MNPEHKAKLATLDKIIDVMDRHMLGRAKPKNAPEVPAEAPPAEAIDGVDMDQESAEDGDLDDESARKLADLYGSDQ